MVGETLGIHPDHVDARAGMAVTAAQQRKIAALVERRIRTRKPAAYLLKRIYMRGVPFYIDERAIVPRSYLGEILDSELFAGESFSLMPDAGAVGQRARSLHRLGLPRDPGRAAVSEGEGRRGRAVEGCAGRRQEQRRGSSLEATRIRLLRGDLFAPRQGARATI